MDFLYKILSMRAFNSPLSCRINSECIHDRVSPQSAMFFRGSNINGPTLNVKYCFLCEYTSMLSGTGPFLSGKWKPEIRSNTRKGILGKTRLMCNMIECQHGRRRVQNPPKVVKWLKIPLKSLSIWLVITAPL